MDAALAVSAESGEHLRRVRAWLGSEPQLAGRMEVISARPVAGELGVGVEALMIALAPGGVAVAVVSGLFGYLRSRRTPIRLRLTRGDGSEVELETEVTGRIPVRQLPGVIDGLATWVDGATLEPTVRDALQPEAARREVG
jgi:hypothetical protein